MSQTDALPVLQSPHPAPEPPRLPGPVPGLPEQTLLDCIHCGICLSTCPTYDLLGTEADSPRGRIYLMRAFAEGRTELTPELVRHLDGCLGCRACETACPSGVHYGAILTQVRDVIEEQYPRPAEEVRARKVLLDLLTHPGRLAPLVFGARVAGALFGPGGGPVGLVNRFLFGPQAPTMPVPKDAVPVVRPLPELTPARGTHRARVVMLPGCVMQVLFQHVNRATLRVLAENGCEVLAPRALGCCGALHMHNGFLQEARTRARRLIAELEALHPDFLVVNSAGCGSALKEYAELFRSGAATSPADAAWVPRAEALVARTRDVCELLHELGLRPPPRAVHRRVAYHDACHLAHGQQVRTQPRALLEQVTGVRLVEFRDPDWCCGSAGIYNFLQPELAARLQRKKVDHLVAAEPELVVTGNPGCHAWIEAGLRATGSAVPVQHTIEVLDEAYGGQH
jgi:glycolate oxidase iron-sulfur subunit